MARPAAPQGEAICNRVLREFYVQWNFKQIAAQKASVGFLFGIGIRHSLVDRQNARLAAVSEADFAPRRAAEPRKCFWNSRNMLRCRFVLCMLQPYRGVNHAPNGTSSRCRCRARNRIEHRPGACARRLVWQWWIWVAGRWLAGACMALAPVARARVARALVARKSSLLGLP
jgi:hypothetical protein